MRNKVIAYKIDSKIAFQDACQFFSTFGVEESVLKKANINFHTPTRIDNVYGKNLLYLNLGITTLNLPFNAKLLTLCSTILLVQQIYTIFKFPKEVREEGFYSNITKAIDISLSQESTNKLGSALVHELTHYLSRSDTVFNKKTDSLARTMELYFLFITNNVKSMDDALAIINTFHSKSCYSKKAFIKGFNNKEDATINLLHKLTITFGENYNYGMFIAGKLFSIYLNESEDEANSFLIKMVSLHRTATLSGIIKSYINTLLSKISSS